jgi:hypothetical protein
VVQEGGVSLRRLVVPGGLAAAALAVAAPAHATNECRGLNPCVAVAGPWVIVPTAPAAQPAKAQFELACPRGFAVGGTDAELTDRAIDIAFLGISGAPVAPGITTSQTIVFVGTWTGTTRRTATFRPHIGCIPTAGGRRTPTGVAQVVPPGTPTVRRVVTARVRGTRRIVASCRPNERLVDWYATRAFDTPAPPPAALVAGLSVSARPAGQAATVVAHGRRGPAVVQVAAVCGGGR